MAYPVCELPDYDFNESFDIDYLRCQYDARAIELINRAEESITEHRYGAIREARDREATRILSQPPTRTPAVNTPPPPTIEPPTIDPPPTVNAPSQLQLLVQQLTYDMLAEQHRLYNSYRIAHSSNHAPPNHPPPYHQAPSHPPPPNHPPRSNRPVIKIALDVSRATAGVGSCGICLSDEIPLAKMVKTSCKHEYCDGCITQIIRTTPRCAFCRGNITTICVNSLEVHKKILNK